MLSREASSPPDNSAASTPAPLTYSNTPPPYNRKRKHAAISGATTATASSPAPSEPGFAGVQPSEDSGVVAANVHASASRPRLTVSRGPVFVPVSEDSIYHSTDQIAINRQGFRYVPAGLAEPGSKIPYRTIESRSPGYVRVSWEDRSPFVKVTTDGLGLCGEKGYRSARLNVPVREGKWYIEIKIERGGGQRPSDDSAKEGAHVRLGWGRREAMLNCPVGLDGYSYGYLDKNGHRITLSRPRPYGQPFGSGDVIGMYISLPPKRKPKANDPYDPAHVRRERIAIDFKGQEYFESVEYPQSKEMIALMDSITNKSKDTASVPSSTKKSATVKNVPERGRGIKPVAVPAALQPLPVLRGSHIAFFVNGVAQGIAFSELYDYLQLRTVPSARKDRSRRRAREGLVEHTENPFDDGWLGYYPVISLFNGARVRVNAGPDFEFSPPADIEGTLAGDPESADTKTRTWRPLCERYSEFMDEQWGLDAIEEAEAQLKTVQQEKKEEKKEQKKSDQPSQSRLTQHSRNPKLPPQPKALLEVKASPVPASSPVPTASSSSLLYQPLPQPEAQPLTQELTEAEKKIQQRRERKRELERARRAKQREEKLRLKQLEEEKLQASVTSAAVASNLTEARLLPVIMGGSLINIAEQPPTLTSESNVEQDLH
ncbi:hypothetical protein EW145_g2857 [Phellinidium pouzarii]|uniref:B30.2/SPRY domain-containing protein n=1 Tax=Phellinidium pouzarii TaxID=167371 RepID=A0A4S4L9H6_9AGAM|nr:hypothetical protein EW145_g2857 [Phellinidium pouzarii]